MQTLKGEIFMRVLFIDIDTLRPDHMGCYGYGRNTTPCIDEIAKEGVIFDNYYTPNAPCLPSRACLATGMYGIHTGIVGHGGTAADMRLEGEPRSFTDTISDNNLFNVFRNAGFYTASISTFAERHSAWWFNAGFNEMHNMGKGGMESAEEVTPIALKWLEDNAKNDNWFLHYHIWDPHTPYRAPEEFGNPFENEPLPDDWINEEIFKEHRAHVGPHSSREISMWDDNENPMYPRHPGSVKDLDELKSFMDAYDCGIKFADDNVKMLLDVLKQNGIYEDTAIIVTSDHGENMGELGLYAEHATADHPCCNIPMIIKWPSMAKGERDDKLRLNLDLAPTMAELLGQEKRENWDGKSYAKVLKKEDDNGYEYVVLSQCAHVCQRSVRFDDYIYIRTVHGGYHMFEREMLFNIKEDPHQTKNLLKEKREIADKGARLILDWEYEMMANSTSDTDPMWTVMKEGGPLHSRGALKSYVDRLKVTERGDQIEKLLKMYERDVNSKYYK